MITSFGVDASMAATTDSGGAFIYVCKTEKNPFRRSYILIWNTRNYTDYYFSKVFKCVDSLLREYKKYILFIATNSKTTYN